MVSSLIPLPLSVLTSVRNADIILCTVESEAGIDVTVKRNIEKDPPFTYEVQYCAVSTIRRRQLEHQGAQANQTKKFDCSSVPHVKGNVNARGPWAWDGNRMRKACMAVSGQFS